MDTNTDNENPIQKTGSDTRPYAVVLYGATSFVGQITAHYLTNFLSNNKNKDGSNVSWAIAGRDEDKLNKLQAKLESKVEIIIANSNDAASLDNMTKQTQVIISTVGPYLKYGEPLIKSCAENGTDYVDLTGEAIFIKDMMDKYQDTAKQSGARI
ncbi:MAG: saccharopine dehydrogenase NADP-binding domain-containing protein, partial [Psychrobacter sp.]